MPFDIISYYFALYLAYADTETHYYKHSGR